MYVKDMYNDYLYVDTMYTDVLCNLIYACGVDAVQKVQISTIQFRPVCSIHHSLSSCLRVKRYTPPDVIADLCVEEDLSSQPPSADKDREEKITIVEMFMPSASSLPVFRDSGFK